MVHSRMSLLIGISKIQHLKKKKRKEKKKKIYTLLRRVKNLYYSYKPTKVVMKTVLIANKCQITKITILQIDKSINRQKMSNVFSTFAPSDYTRSLPSQCFTIYHYHQF